MCSVFFKWIMDNGFQMKKSVFNSLPIKKRRDKRLYIHYKRSAACGARGTCVSIALHKKQGAKSQKQKQKQKQKQPAPAPASSKPPATSYQLPSSQQPAALEARGQRSYFLSY
jgi:hypothetical protein